MTWHKAISEEHRTCGPALDSPVCDEHKTITVEWEVAEQQRKKISTWAACDTSAWKPIDVHHPAIL